MKYFLALMSILVSPAALSQIFPDMSAPDIVYEAPTSSAIGQESIQTQLLRENYYLKKLLDQQNQMLHLQSKRIDDLESHIKDLEKNK